ncbi:MAG: class I SAM-dependent methyltransferase [Betaproteobacteria bacterium]|nr:class I SAM-dependent methyltransferase [Betaproteobacteria bacterium]MBI3939131.1 class I SAM-dependent methyltransferase [Betaproteobacteria bacterium]
MTASHLLRLSFLTLWLFTVAAGALTQARAAEKGYEPQVGQEGKDVVWVPTSQALVNKMLDLAKVTSRDFVIDLGSGDGRTVITAAKRGARALGIEYNPDMVELSKHNAAREGVGDKASFVKADLFETDFSQATVITMFLLPEINLKLRPKILDLKPGTRIVSNSFTMGDWGHDRTATAGEHESCTSYCTAYLWIVPAKVGGTWQLADGELRLKQSYQKFVGTLGSGGRDTVIRNGMLRGDQISFSVGDARYAGRVEGDKIEGTIKSGGNTRKWSATRTGKPAPARS